MTLDFKIASQLREWLVSKNVSFDDKGFPIIPKSAYVKVKPKYIAPWHHRKSYYAKITSICFYMPDNYIYPRFEKVFDEITELKEYHSVCGIDLSVSKKMNRNIQRFIIYLNALYNAVLAYSGIKIIPSLRFGDETTSIYLMNYKDSNIFVTGIHGCSKYMALSSYDEYLFRIMMIILNPKKVLLYGKLGKQERNILKNTRINYEEYEDFRRLYKKGTKIC